MAGLLQNDIFIGFDVRDMFPITSPVQKLSYWESQAMLLSIATWFRGTQVEWNEEMVLLGDDHETMRKFCLKLIESQTMAQSLSKLMGSKDSQAAGKGASAESSASNVRSVPENSSATNARVHISDQPSSPSTIRGSSTVPADPFANPTNRESIYSPYRIHHYIPKEILDGWKLERSKRFSHHVRCNDPLTIQAFDVAYLAYQIEMGFEAQKPMLVDAADSVKTNEPETTRYLFKNEETVNADNAINAKQPVTTNEVLTSSATISTMQGNSSKPINSLESVGTKVPLTTAHLASSTEKVKSTKAIKALEEVLATNPAMTNEALLTPALVKAVKKIKSVETETYDNLGAKEPNNITAPIKIEENIKSDAKKVLVSSANLADEAMRSLYDTLQGMEGSKAAPTPEDEGTQESSITAMIDRCIAKADSQYGFMRDMVIWAHRKNNEIKDSVPDEQVFAMANCKAKTQAKAEGVTEGYLKSEADLVGKISGVLNETATASGENAEFTTRITNLAKKGQDAELARSNNADADYLRAKFQIAHLKKSLDAIDPTLPANQTYPDPFVTAADLTKPANTSNAIDLQEIASAAFSDIQQARGRRVLTKEELEDGSSRPENSFGSHSLRPSPARHSLRPEYGAGPPTTKLRAAGASAAALGYNQHPPNRLERTGHLDLSAPASIMAAYTPVPSPNPDAAGPAPASKLKTDTASLVAARISELEQGCKPSRVQQLEAQVLALEKEVRNHMARYPRQNRETDGAEDGEGDEEMDEIDGGDGCGGEGMDGKKPKNRAERRAEARKKGKGKGEGKGGKK